MQIPDNLTPEEYAALARANADRAGVVLTQLRDVVLSTLPDHVIDNVRALLVTLEAHHDDAIRLAHAAGAMEGFRDGHRAGYVDALTLGAPDAPIERSPVRPDKIQGEADPAGILADSDPDPLPEVVAAPLRQTWDRIDAIVRTAPGDMAQALAMERRVLDRCVAATFRTMFDFGFHRGYSYGRESVDGSLKVQ